MLRSLLRLGTLVLLAVVASSSDAVHDDVDRLYGEAVREGNLEEVLAGLEKAYEDEARGPEERARDMELAVHLRWRHGDVKAARKLANDLFDLAPTAERLWTSASLEEAEGRVQRSRKAYEQLVEDFGDSPFADRARLRLALLPERESAKGEASPLGEWAANLPDEDKNRAAIVLGLVGRPEEALDVFAVAGEGRARFRQEIRAAEWGLDAEEWERAQEHAWRAYEHGTLDRNRRYALTLLVEAHRAEDTIDELVDVLGTREGLEDEAYEVWIALLRETERVDEALALASAGGEAELTVEMRRELLEMCREAGREEELVTRYRRWMEAEPAVLEWREGLSRHYLERGLADEAEALWRDAPVEEASVGQLLLASDVTSGLGLDEFALAYSERAVASGTVEGVAGGLLFQVGLFERRGELPRAIETLDRLEGLLEAASPARMDVAEAWERLGQLERAVATLEAVKEALGGALAEDLEMRLAWLYSEVDREDEALALWRSLWGGIESLPRRRYVGDRMMNVAARLGKLAELAVELEKKLVAGEADDKDSGLLIRIYTKANDPVSAAEVIDEFLGDGDEAKAIQALQEKARIYLSCTDYYHYEEVVRELIERDPEGELDYLRQLAMSQLERGKPEEARDVLERLKVLEGDRSGSEFEAGVLALAGLKEDAIAVYRRGLVDYPERIESYLLLGKLLKESGDATRGVGMFQYLLEHASKDDLFTIAVDGLLNLEAPADVVQWARRRTLERITGRDDKLYLYQLASDLAEQLDDTDEMLRALEAGMPAAREQRSSLLRELMDLTQGGGDSYYMVVNGRLVEQQRENPMLAQHLRYGRRLVGLGELVPPQVYLDLGNAFLEADDVRAATKTYALLSRLPEADQFDREVARSLEDAGYAEAALDVYERVLLGDVGDVSLITKIGTLHEKLGNDAAAAQQYLRGMRLLLSRRPVVSDEEEEVEEENAWDWWSRERNVDDFDQYGDDLFRGWLITTTPEAAEVYWREELATLRTELDEVLAAHAAKPAPKDGEERAAPDLRHAPRSLARLEWIRDSALPFQRTAVADEADRLVLERCPGTEGLLERAVERRVKRGYVASARGLLDVAAVPEEERASARLLVGGSTGEGGPGALPAEEVAALLLPLWVADRTEDLETVLTRVNLNQVRGEDLYAMQAMMSSLLCLERSTRVLELGRHWIRVVLANEQLGWKGQEYTKVLERTRLLLDEKTFRAMLDYLVDLVDEEFEGRMDLMDVVLEEGQGFEPPLLDAERAEAWLGKLAEVNPYHMHVLLPFVAEEDRPRLLQSVWPKTPATSRSYVVMNFVLGVRGEQREDLIEVLVGMLEEALADSDARSVSTYTVRRLFEEERDPRLVEPILDLFEEYQSDLAGLDVFRARWLVEQERWDEVDERLDPLFRAWLSDDPLTDWTARRGRDWLLELGWRRSREVLERVFADWEATEQRSESTVRRRVAWLQHVGELEEARVALDAALAEFPEDDGLRDEHVALLEREGDRNGAVRARLTKLDEDPEDEELLADLVRRFRGLEHPVRAKELQLRVDSLADEPATHDGEDADLVPVAEKQVAATMEAVKEAWDEGRTADAVSLFRRQWRSFPSGDDRFVGMIFFGGGGSAVPYPWPADEEDDAEAEEEDEPPARGGLSSFREVVEDEDDDGEQDPDAVSVDDPAPEEDEPRSAYEVLPTRAEGEAEVRRILRAKSSQELDRSQAIFDGLATVVAGREGPAAAIAAGIDDLRSGRSGKEAATLLLTLCERHPEAVGDELSTLVDDLIRTVHPLDGHQLRRMARILVRLGRVEDAARVYRWCATLCTTERYYFDDEAPFPAIPREALVEEVSETFEDEATRLEVVRAVLAWSKPGRSEYAWELEAFYAFALSTWRKAVGEDRMLEYAADLFEGIADTRYGIVRSGARLGADVLARTGRVDEAVRFLDLGLCEQDASGSLLPEPRWSNYDERGSYGHDDLRRWFPVDWEGWENPLAWCASVSVAVPRWVEEDRYGASSAIKLLLLCSLRQHELGDTEGAHVAWDAAARMLEGLSKPGEVGDFDRWSQVRTPSADLYLWLADVARRSGREAAAVEIERRLFDEGRLHRERVPDVLRAIRDADGAAAAYAVAEREADVSYHAGLLDVLVELATELDDAEAVARWTAAASEAEAAREWWEARDEADAEQDGR